MSKRAKRAWAAIGVAAYTAGEAVRHASWFRVVDALVCLSALIGFVDILRRPPAGPVELPPGATAVVFPSFDGGPTSGRVIRWLKAAGDDVEVGEPLVEVEIGKVATEIPAAVSGVLCAELAPVGRDIDVGAAIAGIVPPGLGAWRAAAGQEAR